MTYYIMNKSHTSYKYEQQRDIIRKERKKDISLILNESKTIKKKKTKK